jgi:hypothetical protein
MASVSRISGLRPVKHVSGGSYTGQANVYFVPSSNSDVIMVGDVVKLAGDSRSPTGVPMGATLAAVDVGLNAEVDVTAGNTASGASGMAVDLSTKAVTATLPLKVVGFPYRPDNNIGDAFTNVYVRINNHQLNSGTGSAGV